MMFYPPIGYIMFRLKKLKFYGGWGLPKTRFSVDMDMSLAFKK